MAEIKCEAEWLEPVNFHYQLFNNSVEKFNYNKLQSDNGGKCFTIHTPEKIRVYSRIENEFYILDDEEYQHSNDKFNEVLDLVPGKLTYGYNEECDINRNSSTTVSLVNLVHEQNSETDSLHLGTVVDFRNVHIYRLGFADQLYQHNEQDERLDRYKTKIVHDRVITDIDFSNTWRTLATCSVDRYARIWDLRDDSKKKSSIDIKDSITALHFIKFMNGNNNSESNHNLAIANADMVKFYDIRKADRAYEEIGCHLSNYPFTSMKAVSNKEILVNTGYTLEKIRQSCDGTSNEVVREYSTHSQDIIFSWSDSFGKDKEFILDLKVYNQADLDITNEITIFKKDNASGKAISFTENWYGDICQNKAVGNVIGCTWLQYSSGNAEDDKGKGQCYYLLCLVYLKNRPGNHLQFQVLKINIKQIEETLQPLDTQKIRPKSEPTDAYKTKRVHKIEKKHSSRPTKHSKTPSISYTKQKQEQPKECRARFCGGNKFVMIKPNSQIVKYGEIKYSEKIHGVNPNLAAQVAIDKNRFDFCEEIKRYYTMELKTQRSSSEKENLEGMVKLWSMACALTRPLINPEREREADAFSNVVSLSNSRRSSMKRTSFNKRNSSLKFVNRLSNAEILQQMSKESKQRYSDWRWIRMPAVANMVENWIENLGRKDIQTCALLVAAFRDQLGCTLKPYITPRKYQENPEIQKTQRKHRESEVSNVGVIEKKQSDPKPVPGPFETPFLRMGNTENIQRMPRGDHLLESVTNPRKRPDIVPTHSRRDSLNLNLFSHLGARDENRRNTEYIGRPSRRNRTRSENEKPESSTRLIQIKKERKQQTLKTVDSGTSLHSLGSPDNLSRERKISESSKSKSKKQQNKIPKKNSNFNKIQTETSKTKDKYGFTRSVFLTGKYDLFILAYCEWLGRNRLYTQRASFLKVLSQPVVDANSSIAKPNVLKQLIPEQSNSKEILNCDWCKLEVKGLFLKCTKCGHGGHWSHRTEISEGLLPVNCPRPECSCICYEIP